MLADEEIILKRWIVESVKDQFRNSSFFIEITRCEEHINASKNLKSEWNRISK